MLSINMSIILYLFVYTTSTAFIYLYEKKNLISMLFLGMLLPSLLAAIRYGVGTDYYGYYKIFSNLDGLNFIEVLQMDDAVEIGFRIISKVSLMLSSNIQFVFGFIAFLTSLMYLIAYKEIFGKKGLTLFYFIYLFTIFSNNLNGMRQGLAMGIVFLGIKYLYKNNLIMYVLVIFIAATIHTTALFALPLIFLKFKVLIDYVRYNPFLFILFSVLIFYAVLFLTTGNLDAYIDKFTSYIDVAKEGGKLTIAVNLIIAILLLFLNFIFKDNLKYKFILKIIPFYILALLSGYLSVTFIRIQNVFGWAPNMLISNLNLVFEERQIINYFIVLFYLIQFIVIYGLLGQSHIIPFQWN